MKIAVFTHSFLPKFSGAEIFHHNLASRLVARGHSVSLVLPRKLARSLAGRGWALPYETLTFPGNIASYHKRWPWLAGFLASRKLDALQRRHRFDLWHGVMMFPSGIELVPWATRRGVPHLVRSAGDDVIASPGGEVGQRLDPRINRLVRREIPKAQAVVALSDSIRDGFLELGLPPGAIHTIPNAADISRFDAVPAAEREPTRERLGARQDAFLFLAVGRNHPQKNYPALLDAARELKEDSKVPFQVLVLGRGADQVEARARELGLGGVVLGREIRFPAGSGAAPEFPPQELVCAYKAADAFVMPSVLEGFSTALLEAMAARLPAITTDAPGCKDFVRGGRDAVMVRAGDVAALAGAMRAMLDSDDMRQEYSRRSGKRAAEFGWDTVVARYESLYAKLALEPKFR